MIGTDRALPTRVALRQAFREAPALRRGLGVTVLFALVGTGLQIVVPILVQQIIDQEVLSPDGIEVAGVLIRGGIALAAMAVAVLASRAAILRAIAIAARGLSDLRVKTFAHLHGLSVLHVESERRGSLVSRVTSDISTIQDFLEWGGVNMLIGTTQVMLAIAVMTFYRWQLALLVVGGVVVYALLLSWFQRILRRAHDRVRERVADSLSAVGEAISGLPVIRAYGAEAATQQRVDAALEAQFRAEFRTGRLGAILFSSAEVFAGALTAAVVATGVVLGAARGTTAGTLLAFLFLVNLLVEPVQNLVETLDHAQTAGAGLRRVLRVLETPIEVVDPETPVPLPSGGLDVHVEGVSFTYPSGEQAVRAVTTAIPAGKRIAVVGETGSGKTTFAKLVTRILEPEEGWVLLGGVPFERVALAELRGRVAFVPQEGFLFDATVADNVRYGKPDAGDDEVLQAFRDLGLGEWVTGLPDGLATPVGERGGQLSAGERQLVALTRAWIADPDLLVLDEATSAVDPALEVQLRRAIERLTEGRTSITVAHRLSTAEAADEVLVFDRGDLVERGHHDDLVTAGGVYADLYADWAHGTAVV